MLRRPALHQVGEHLELRRGRGKAALRMARGNALAVIYRAVEGGRLPQKVGICSVEVAQFLDHADALGSVQHLEENARALEPQVHQGEIDVVITALAGLERIARSLLPLE